MSRFIGRIVRSIPGTTLHSIREFTTDPASEFEDVVREHDKRYRVDGTAHIREINRLMRWELPTDGPKTLNGLVLEQLERIPEAGTCFKLAGYPIEIVESNDNKVVAARIHAEKGAVPET